MDGASENKPFLFDICSVPTLYALGSNLPEVIFAIQPFGKSSVKDSRIVSISEKNVGYIFFLIPYILCSNLTEADFAFQPFMVYAINSIPLLNIAGLELKLERIMIIIIIIIIEGGMLAKSLA